MKRTAVTLIVGFWLGAPCCAQDPPAAPDYSIRSGASAVGDGQQFSGQADPEFIPPQTPPSPPNVPPRPPLLPVQNAAPFGLTPGQPGYKTPSGSLQLPNSSFGLGKPSLAWRAKAHKLKISNSAPDATLSMSYHSAISTIVDTISRAGLRIQALNEDAGELVAVSNDAQANARILVVFNEMPPGSVSVRATALGSGKSSALALQSILFGLGGQVPAKGTQVAAPAAPRGSL